MGAGAEKIYSEDNRHRGGRGGKKYKQGRNVGASKNQKRSTRLVEQRGWRSFHPLVGALWAGASEN